MTCRSWPGRLATNEIAVRFEDDPVPAELIIATAKKLGVNLRITPRELDVLRSKGAQLRKWLSADWSRHDAFLRNPGAALAAVDRWPSSEGSPGLAPDETADRSPYAGTDMATAKAAELVADWIVAEPERLASFFEHPGETVSAALAGHHPGPRDRLLETAAVVDRHRQGQDRIRKKVRPARTGP